ncbi:MAG: porphobilinogen synthase [Planctomycetota bacterium]|nr:porphobilinogen synthase [Planctomycetota bacterium]
MVFPIERSRRLRRDSVTRSMVRENKVTMDDLILPLFVRSGVNLRNEIKSMPGCYHLSPDELRREVAECVELGVKSFILFGLPDEKDEVGSEAYAENGIVQQALAGLREEIGHSASLIADVCLCEYTDHGHCGVLVEDRGIVTVSNDPTLELLGRSAVSLAQAGADIIAPSDMMDGRIGRIREMLDANKFEDRPIMSYAVKYASAFYGPFRDAAESAPQKGDRATYQMDPANSREAIREALQDVDEGADIIMVKPALPYLDIIRQCRDTLLCPIAAYNVSGEYSMIKAGAAKGWIDGDRVGRETLLSIKRAGADLILTYFAKDAATWVKQGLL